MKLFLIIFILFSCATPYYNAFFHAETAFEKGEEEWQKEYFSGALSNRSFKSAELDEAIKNCKYVLERFGVDPEKNAYADDAYLMVAKASYYLEDYSNVIRSAEFIKKNIPNSPFVPEINLLVGDTYRKQGDFLRAKEAYKSIPLRFQNLELVAKSKLSTAKILLKEDEIEEAKQVLERTIQYEKNNEFDGEYDENTRYELLNILTDLYKEEKQYVKILSVTEDVLSFEDVQLKKKLIEKRLEALEELDQKDLFADYIEEVSEDNDFDLEPEFIDYLKLKLRFLENDFSDIASDFSNFYFTYPSSEYDGKVGLLEVNVLEQFGNVDSALILYGKTISKIKDVKDRDFHKDRYNEISERHKLFSNEKILTKKLISASDRLDSLKTYVTDSVYNIKLRELKSKGQQKAENDYQIAQYYFKQSKYRETIDYFKKYTEVGEDDEKLASSYIHIAYLNEKQNKVLADSLYQYVYKTFKSQKENQLLMDRIGIKEGYEDYDKSVYSTFLDQVSIETIRFPDLNSIVNATKSKLDTTSVYQEKLDYYRIHFLLKDSLKNSLTVKYITEFKEKYPTSVHLAELNNFYLTQEELDAHIASEKEIEEKANIPELITGRIDTYTFSRNVDVNINVILDMEGIVSKYTVLSKVDEDVKIRIEEITKSWEFKPSFEEEVRNFNLKLLLRKTMKKKPIERNKKRRLQKKKASKYE